LELNKTAIELFKQNFFFGVGFNNFLKLLPFFPTGKVFLIQPVHNIYLLVLSESGIFGGLFFLSLFWVVLKKVIIGKRFFLLLSLLVILISGFLDHYWLTLPQNLLLLALIFGIGLNNQENVKI
jgi:O-antigen ligase